MSSEVQTGTVTTQVPARLDRLPWSRFHWRVVVGLGGGKRAPLIGLLPLRLWRRLRRT